jgi:D-glycero-beta-D-manno-heptose 1-phosphate adenylyltransferase
MGVVMTVAEAIRWRDELANQLARVVLTNGIFDLLHVGHLHYLRQARALGEVLLVGINSDLSAAQLKPGRPFVSQSERAELLAALDCVSAVVIFEECTAEALVAALRPDFYVKGGDYGRPGQPEPPEAATARAHGGTVRYLSFLPGHSTSSLIERICASR